MSEPCCISDPQLCQKQLWRSQSISTSFESSLQGWGFSHSNGVILKHVVVKWSDVWVILFSDMWYLLLELFTGTVSTNQCWSNTSTITWLFQTLRGWLEEKDSLLSLFVCKPIFGQLGCLWPEKAIGQTSQSSAERRTHHWLIKLKFVLKG